jgi:hypothetical protein
MAELKFGGQVVKKGWGAGKAGEGGLPVKEGRRLHKKGVESREGP